MKKVFLIIFLILTTFGILKPNNVFAQVTVTPIPSSNIPWPTSGINLLPKCGDVDATPPANLCCNSQMIKSSDTITKTGNIIVDNLFIDNLNTIFRVIKSTVFLEPLQETVWKYVQPCFSGSPSTPGDLTNKNCTCIIPTPAPLTGLSKYCTSIIDKNEQELCTDCTLKKGAIWTSIGCVSPNVKDFIEKTVLGFGIGLAGMIALLCIIYAAIRLQTSQGNPENIKKAQELLTSCIMGLMLIIFSVFILRLIGVDILKIPGFSK